MAPLPCLNTMPFLPHILTLASTWGPCPPQSVSLLRPAHSPASSSNWLRLFSSQIFSCTNTPKISSGLFFLLTPPMKTEETECSEMSTYKIQTPGTLKKKGIQHSEHGKSLKSRISAVFPT